MQLLHNTGKYTALLTEKLKSGMDVATAYGQIALVAAGDVKQAIANREFAANSQLTVSLKGSSTPLVDSGRLRQSIKGIVK